MELALAELRLVCVFVARTFEIEQAWEEWDKMRYVPSQLHYKSFLINPIPEAMKQHHHI